MWEYLKAALNAANDAPMLWAGMTLGFALIAAMSGFWAIMAFALVTAYQWGYALASRMYEKGIMCAECGDRLDVEEDPRAAL